jgi:hypothetical protein
MMVATLFIRSTRCRSVDHHVNPSYQIFVTINYHLLNLPYEETSTYIRTFSISQRPLRHLSEDNPLNPHQN